jgi:outer membrane protein insertion porin family
MDPWALKRANRIGEKAILPAGRFFEPQQISQAQVLPRRCRVRFLALFFAALSLFAQQTPPVWIRSVTFEGNKSMDARQLQSLLRRSSEGDVYTAANLSADLQLVERAYQDEGHLRVEVGRPDVRIQTEGEKRVADIRIPISEGSVYTAGQLAVRNAQVLGQDAVMQICPLKKGQPYSRIKGSQWQAVIEEDYRSLGYIRFRCAAREDVDEAGKTVNLILECVEGKPYRVGKITVAGDESIDPLDFKRRLLLSEGGSYNPDMLILSVQFLNQMGRFRRISKSDVKIRIDDAKGTVDLEWHLSLPQ